MNTKLAIPELWSIKEAADNTNISTYCIRKLVKENKVKHIKTGKKYLVNALSLCNFLNGEED